MRRKLSALLTYAGGKRRLVKKLLGLLRESAAALVLIDAFLGGGSVSLAAKERGYRVVCNDGAERSAIVGRALIENDRVKLTRADSLRLFVPYPGAGTFIRERFARKVVTTAHAIFLDNAFAVARSMAEPKRSLLLLLLMKFVLGVRPMSNFGARRIVEQMETGDWDSMNINFVRDALARNIHGHPFSLVERLRHQVNQGVFFNGHQHEVHRLDALDFIQKVKGDVLYLDPPYAGTAPYETSLRPLDEMLAGHPLTPRVSRFSKREGLQALDELLSHASHFPLWMISYGNAHTTLEELVAVVGKYRPVEHAEAIRYVHCTGLSSEQHRARNRELLVVARRK